MITRFVRSLACAVCIMAVLGGAVPGRSQQDPLAAAFTQRNAELVEIKSRLAAAQEQLGALEQDVSRLAPLLQNRPDLTSAQTVEVDEQLYEASLRLQRHAALGRTRALTDKVSQATDAAYELELLNKALRDTEVGAPLRALVVLAEELGVDSTALRERIDAYAGTTLGLIEATDKLAREIKTMRAQARLGSEAYGGANDPRYRQLVAQRGQALADAATYLPSSPWELFRPVARAGKEVPNVVLMWDEQEQDWYRIDGSVPVEAIFRDAYVGLDRRPTPGTLKYLAENFAQVKRQEAAADALASYLLGVGWDSGKAPQNDAFSRLAEGEKVLASLGDAATFRAKFVYDGSFRAWVLQALDHLRQDLVKQGSAAESGLRELDELSRRHDITLESQWAQGPLPEAGDVRVVAWFSDNPKSRFASTWRFEREKVTIDVNNGVARNNGHAHGIRSGNVVRSERSIPGRNCIASDERVFEKGGKLTFSSVYVCTLQDGTTQINNVAGAGTWEIVSPRAKIPSRPLR